TSLADSNAGGSGALRAAISASNATAGPNEIDILTPGTYALTLNGTATDNSAGELAILNNDVAILNHSGGPVVIDAGGLTTPERVLDIAPTGSAVTVTLTGVTIQGGAGVNIGGGLFVEQTSTPTLNNDIVQDNSAALAGGGILTYGMVTLNHTTVRANTSQRQGGGLVTVDGSIVVQDNSVITGNSAVADGGGFYVTSGMGLKDGD